MLNLRSGARQAVCRDRWWFSLCIAVKSFDSESEAGVLPPPTFSEPHLNCVNLGKVIALLWSCWPQVYHVHLNCGETTTLLALSLGACVPALTGL